jgi:hypothetical protein
VGLGRDVAHVQAAAGVDHRNADPGRVDLADLVLARQQEAAAHERMIHPAALQVVQVHSDP